MHGCEYYHDLLEYGFPRKIQRNFKVSKLKDILEKGFWRGKKQSQKKQSEFPQQKWSFYNTSSIQVY